MKGFVTGFTTGMLAGAIGGGLAVCWIFIEGIASYHRRTEDRPHYRYQPRYDYR